MSFKEITFDKPNFPFKLCTTTFIYPADWIANARVLGRVFDELELLLFESEHPDSLPASQAIGTLAALSDDLDFTWHVHLPIDLHPGHPERSMRQRAVEVIKQVVDLTVPLAPTTYTLHLPGIVGQADGPAVQRWQGYLYETLESLIDYGIPGRSFSIENITDYPLEMALPVIEAFDMEVCLDIGHLLVQKGDLETAFRRFRDRLTLLHVHGIAADRDHQRLDRLPASVLQTLMGHLSDFSGTVSLEVFSKKDLLASVACLVRAWP